MHAKNFLISPLSTQQVFVLFLLTFRPKALNLANALKVPLPLRQEKESAMKIRSNDGYKTR